MKILLCHSYYQQRGGEDQSFDDEAWLLESHGHDVVRYTLRNEAIPHMNRWNVAWRTVWNPQTYREVRELIRARRPEVMHCTNTFPLMSPAVYYAARAEGVPVVQALRDYRLVCPNTWLLRDGHICEDCLGKSPLWRSVWHGCYRHSRAASAVTAAMLGVHGMLKTWTRAVTMYYALTQFTREKFVAGGLPAARIAVKPNFVHPDPGPGEGRGGYAVFVGRLSSEKGIELLLDAWTRLDAPVSLKIIGDGPLAEKVRAAAEADRRISWLGRRPLGEVLPVVAEAACLVMPSITYETFGRAMAEAFATGTPVVAGRMGTMAELVDDGRTGLHFQPANADDLAQKVRQLLADPRRLATMRLAARQEYEAKYTAEANHRMLLDIYAQALAAPWLPGSVAKSNGAARQQACAGGERG